MRDDSVSPSVCIFSSICQEDFHWLDQYLAEVDRLGIPFAMHFDRCRNWTKEKVRRHPRCIGTTEQDNHDLEFNETHKQQVFDLVFHSGFDWAMAWDVDETYERGARRKIEEITRLDADYVDVNWVNLWGDEKHIRIDGPFSCGHRVKFYNLRRNRWAFLSPITNGPKIVDSNGRPVSGRINPSRERETRYDLTCLHHGMMTAEMRRFHKARWDRIYSTALRGDSNPYKFWEYACDEETYPPTIVEHDYR